MAENKKITALSDDDLNGVSGGTGRFEIGDSIKNEIFKLYLKYGIKTRSDTVCKSDLEALKIKIRFIMDEDSSPLSFQASRDLDFITNILKFLRTY